MTDYVDDLDEQPIVSAEDATAIGLKIVEMAERVGKVHKAVPGAQAAWGFDMDDVHFRVVVTVE